ncbi:MAG: hypothetical protein ABH828_01580 [archaeon]
MARGQISIEFMSMAGIGIVLSMMFIGVLIFFLQDTNQDRKDSEMEHFAMQLQNEIILASEVHEGYSRQIYLSSQVGKYDYKINNTENHLILEYDESVLSYRIPKTVGKLQKGLNTIKNMGGEVVVVE